MKLFGNKNENENTQPEGSEEELDFSAMEANEIREAIAAGKAHPNIGAILSVLPIEDVKTSLGEFGISTHCQCGNPACPAGESYDEHMLRIQLAVAVTMLVMQNGGDVDSHVEAMGKTFAQFGSDDPMSLGIFLHEIIHRLNKADRA